MVVPGSPAAAVTETPAQTAERELGEAWFLRQLQANPNNASVFMQQLRHHAPHAFAAPPANGVTTPVPEPTRLPVKSIEDKHYRRVEKYTGAAGTWQEWSFGFVTATQAIIPAVGMVLEAMNRASESTVTIEAVDRVPGISAEIKARFGTKLFTVLNGLTMGEASTVVRGVISKVGDRCGFAAF